MTREELLRRIAEEYGIDPEYPWNDRNAVLRRRDNRKWFAVILEVRADRLGLPGTEIVDVVNVKCDPRMIGSLLQQPGFHRAYHMNKEKWLSIRLDGSARREDICALVSMSYDETGPKRKKNPHGI